MFRVALALSCCLAVAPVGAEEVLPELPDSGDSSVDAGHQRVSRAVTELADSIDTFFSDEIHEEQINRSRIRLSGGLRVAEYDGVDPLFRVRLNLKMPRITRRLNLVVDSAGDASLSDDIDVDSGEDGDLAGFLRFFVFKGDPTLLALDAGLRFRPVPDPFLRARLLREFAWGRTILRPTQFFVVDVEDGLGTRTRVDLDRRLNRKTLLRLRGDLEVTMESHGLEMRPAALLYRRIDRRSWLRLKLGIEADSDPPRTVDRYVVGARYRRNVWRRWLFVEIEPMFRFDDDREYRPAPAIDLRLETIFGGNYGS